MPAPASCSLRMPTSCSAENRLVRIGSSLGRRPVEDSHYLWTSFRGSRQLDHLHAGGFAGPGETEPLFAGVDPLAERAFQGVEVDLALVEDLGEVFTLFGESVFGDGHRTGDESFGIG